MSSKNSSKSGGNGSSSSSSGSISASFLGLKAELERNKASSSTTSSSSSSTKRKSSASSLLRDNLDERQSKRKLSSTFLDTTSTKPRKATVTKSPLSGLPSRSSKDKDKDKRQAKSGANSSSSEASQPLDTTIKANLERKAKIYDQLQRGKFAGISSEQLKNDGCIDWDRKVLESSTHLDHYHHYEEESPPPPPPPAAVYGGGEAEEEIEYVDEFGRTRKAPLNEVPREFVPIAYGGDKEPESESEGVEWDNAIYGPSTSFPVYDPSLHRKAKMGEEGKMQQQHFNAGFENRYRGAAFYKFSDNEQVREREMRELKRLREETIAQRGVGKSTTEKEEEKDPLAQ